MGRGAPGAVRSVEAGIVSVAPGVHRVKRACGSPRTRPRRRSGYTVGLPGRNGGMSFRSLSCLTLRRTIRQVKRSILSCRTCHLLPGRGGDRVGYDDRRRGCRPTESREAMRVAPKSASPTIASAMRPANCQVNQTGNVTSRSGRLPRVQAGTSATTIRNGSPCLISSRSIVPSRCWSKNANSSTTCCFNRKLAATSSDRGPFSPPNFRSQ